MQGYSLTHVSDAALLRDLAALVVRDRLTTAEILAHIAEVDARRLYAPAGYSSMHAYCVGELRLSEDGAFKRIQAARVAQRFPEIFSAVADGRLHLIGVCLLAPHLKPENARELIEGASCKCRPAIEEWLATHFTRRNPSIDLAACQLATSQVAVPVGSEVATSQVEALAAEAPTRPEVATSQVEPRYPKTLLVRARLSQAKLRYAQALLSHALPSGDVDQVLDRALEALIQQLERRKAGATARPRHSRLSASRRHISAEIRRAVWERDRGQCTFVSTSGRRCDERRFLEFDHIEPVARGGRATAENIRLRCRTHNQYEAERAFGADFMSHKRTGRTVSTGSKSRNEKDQERDVLAGLRNLGCRPGDARRAIEYAAALPVASVEERMRAALQFLGAKFVSNRPQPAG